MIIGLQARNTAMEEDMDSALLALIGQINALKHARVFLDLLLGKYERDHG